MPIPSSARRPLGAAYVPILLSEFEQEQRPSGYRDREAIVVGARLCDREGERAYTVYDPHFIFDHCRKSLHFRPNFGDRKTIPLQSRPNSLSTIFDMSISDQIFSTKKFRRGYISPL